MGVCSCSGSYYTHCYPYPVWSSTSASGVDYYNQEYVGGSFATSLVRASTHAFSVRCYLFVLQLVLVVA